MDKEAEAYLGGSRGEAHFGGTIAAQAAHERGLNSRSGGVGLCCTLKVERLLRRVVRLMLIGALLSRFLTRKRRQEPKAPSPA